MVNLNNEIAIEIIDAKKNGMDIYTSKHDKAIISHNLKEMERLGFIMFKVKPITLEDGTINGQFNITEIGEKFYVDFK